MITRKSGSMPIHDSEYLCNLILDNYQFDSNPFSKEELQYFLSDPQVSQTILNKTNELIKPFQLKSGAKKSRNPSNERD
jgi:hypothetical protein